MTRPRRFLPAPALFPALVLVLFLAACASHQKADDRAAPRPAAGAVPRIEPLRAANSRPYTVAGRRYVPMSSSRPFRQEGVASWYGPGFHGGQTATGERYDMHAFSAAHPTLPLPSYARVTRLDNGASVIVRVNDRGPFKAARIIDLSRAAAAKLGFIRQGSTKVRVQAITHDEIRRANWQPGPADSPPPAVASPTAVYLQFGAFREHDNAQALLHSLTGQLPAGTPAPHIQQQGGLYRVRSGPWPSRPQARAAARRIEAHSGHRASVVY